MEISPEIEKLISMAARATEEVRAKGQNFGQYCKVFCPASSTCMMGYSSNREACRKHITNWFISQ